MMRICMLLMVTACSAVPNAWGQELPSLESYTLDFNAQIHPVLQRKLEAIDAALRAKYGMTSEQTAVGVLDLKRLELAMLHPDRIDYAASVAKVGILLAYFQLHPEAATRFDPQTRHELGLMREIFASPDIPHDDIKFVKGLAGRDVQIVRKWGTWENWHHDSAVVRGPGRHYILVALTNHPKGDEYLVTLAGAVDDFMAADAPKR